MKMFMNIREHSERVKKKSLSLIGGIPLYRHSLIKFNDYDIYVDTDSEQILEDCAKSEDLQHVNAYERWQEHKGQNPGTAMIRRFVNEHVADGEFFYVVHVTSPFLKTSSLKEAWTYLQGSIFDSVCSVTEHHEFMFRETGKDADFGYVPINFAPSTCPRTQDLEPLFSLNHAFYLLNKETFLKHGNKIGDHPLFYPLEYPENIDIDTEADLLLARHYFESIIQKEVT